MWLSIDQIMEVKQVIFAGYSKENSMEKHMWYFVNKIVLFQTDRNKVAREVQQK